MENTTQGTGTIQAKVCLAFKLDTSNDHIRTRVVETFTHTVLFNTTCQRPICPRFESTKVDRTFEPSKFFSNRIPAIIHHNLSRTDSTHEIAPKSFAVQLNSRK